MMTVVARLSCEIIAALVPLAMLTTAAADAQPFDPWLVESSSDTSPAYVLEVADGSVVFGGGLAGQLLTGSSAFESTYGPASA